MNSMRHQHRKFPDSETRRKYIEENFSRDTRKETEKYSAAMKSMYWILGELNGYTLKIYEQRDQALRLLEEGDIEGAKFWLNKIGAIE